MSKHPARKPRRPREKVLVVMRPDGLVEVYSEPHIDVYAVNRLDVGRDETPGLANLIDAYHEGTMPRAYRDLYWPSKSRHIALHERRTTKAALDTLHQLSILRGLQAEREALRPAPAAIMRAKRRARP